MRHNDAGQHFYVNKASSKNDLSTPAKYSRGVWRSCCGLDFVAASTDFRGHSLRAIQISFRTALIVEIYGLSRADCHHVLFCHQISFVSVTTQDQGYLKTDDHLRHQKLTAIYKTNCIFVVKRFTFRYILTAGSISRMNAPVRLSACWVIFSKTRIDREPFGRWLCFLSGRTALVRDRGIEQKYKRADTPKQSGRIKMAVRSHKIDSGTNRIEACLV